MKRYLLTTLLISTSVSSAQTIAYDLNDAANTVNQTANTVNAMQNTKNNLEGKNDLFNDNDRKTYKEYYGKENKASNKKKDLPPGLQKKVANGGSLPPGWQKKVEAGQVFDSELRGYAYRSPYNSPKGTSTYILENKVVRVLDATNVILDVLTN